MTSRRNDPASSAFRASTAAYARRTRLKAPCSARSGLPLVKPEHRLNTFLTFRNTAPALPSTSPEPSDASPATAETAFGSKPPLGSFPEPRPAPAGPDPGPGPAETPARSPPEPSRAAIEDWNPWSDELIGSLFWPTALLSSLFFVASFLFSAPHVSSLASRSSASTSCLSSMST